MNDQTPSEQDAQTQQQEVPTAQQPPAAAPAAPAVANSPGFLERLGGSARVVPVVIAFAFGVFSVFAVQGMTDSDRPEPVRFQQGGPGQMGPPGQMGQGQMGPGQMGQGQGGWGQGGPPGQPGDRPNATPDSALPREGTQGSQSQKDDQTQQNND